MWTDGSRLEDGGVGAEVAFWSEGRWVRRGTHLGKNKEAFDAEVFILLRAVGLLCDRGESGKRYTIFSDSRAAVSRIQHDRCGPTQALAKAVIARTDELAEWGNTLTFRWTPSHEGVAGNEQADEAARLAAEGEGDRAVPEYIREASLSHLKRKTTEARSQATAQWIREQVGRRRRYHPHPGGRL